MITVVVSGQLVVVFDRSLHVSLATDIYIYIFIYLFIFLERHSQNLPVVCGDLATLNVSVKQHGTCRISGARKPGEIKYSGARGVKPSAMGSTVGY